MERAIEILKSICDLPTAPFCEQHVKAWLRKWAGEKGLAMREDGAGNLYVEYVRGERSKTPLVIEAHMDHPGFMVVGNEQGDGAVIVRAEFRGGVKPSYFAGQAVKFFLEDENPLKQAEEFYVPRGKWVEAKVLEIKAQENSRAMDVWLKCAERLPLGTLGMWALTDAEIKDQRFYARVCDDLAGVAAIVSLLEELLEKQVEGHVIGMFDRGEEVGFAGVIAACENQWVPAEARVIGLETSSGLAFIGNGPIIRVGDRSALYSTSLTHFLTQSAGFISDDDSTFIYQRRLMDGGTCNSTAFAAWEFDSAAICVALGNYHNMTPAERIAPEFISVPDYLGMIRILVKAVERYPKYVPGFSEMRERFRKLHQAEHVAYLYPKPPSS